MRPIRYILPAIIMAALAGYVAMAFRRVPSLITSQLTVVGFNDSVYVAFERKSCGAWADVFPALGLGRLPPEWTQYWILIPTYEDEWFVIPYWCILVVTVPVWFVLRRRARELHRRSRLGACMSCGYDLTGNESGVCSECGDVVASEPRGSSA